MQASEADSESLTARPQTAERARDATRRFLASVAPASMPEADAVLLVVSELVTNALRHAGEVTRFRLEARPGTVTVSVDDPSRAAPCALPRDVERPGGFGWHLVRSLSAEVQVRIRPGGKTVSAVLPLPR
ncbi:ATP-binding protein [Streptomyces kurssanovii]|nr:ATP-binding protein [Streptomyces kurssanovii]